MKTRLALFAGLLAGLFVVSATAQSYKPFPGETLDQRTRSIQESVEEVYSAGDYERALLLYEKELAPIGDKYAQYMVGFMHVSGQGVAPDRVKALAWYRLAAERGEPLLEQTRDALMMQMSADEVSASDAVFLQLWKEMGDRALIMELIRRDMRQLRAQTGTRIPGATASGPSVIYRASGEPVGPNFYRNVRRQLAARIAYLDATVEISDVVLADEVRRIRLQEAEVKQELAAMENR